MKKQNLSCGSCLFLKRDRIYDRKCDDLGKLPSSKACTAYKPDTFLFVGSIAANRIKQVASALKGMSVSEVQALGAVLQAEKTTRKAGWEFYQRVYIRYTGTSASSYFSNFAVGYVVYADAEFVRIIGASGRLMIKAVNDKDSSTVYSIDRFKALAAVMTAKKHFSDPRRDIVKTTIATVQPLDDVLESDDRLARKLVKTASRTDDLVAIIAKMSRGHSLKKKSPKRETGGELSVGWRA